MNVCVFSKDLLDQSKVRKQLSSSVEFASSVSTIAESNADAFLIDLTNPDALLAIEALKGKLTVGFGSHVDIDRMEKASESGCVLTVPRSRFFARMQEVIDEAAELFSNSNKLAE